jgi:hypothetical protein
MENGWNEDESEEFEPEEELTPEELEQLEEERRAAERSHFSVTRSLPAGLLFALPLLAVYELGVLKTPLEMSAGQR